MTPVTEAEMYETDRLCGFYPALDNYLSFNLRPAIEKYGDMAKGIPEPELYATLTTATSCRDDEFLPKGTRVRVVMASRFGDVGITSDLTKTHGYQARVACPALTDFSTKP